MKIAILITDVKSTGGVARVVANLANSFNRIKSYEVEIISCYKSDNENIQYEIDEKVKINFIDLDMNIALNKIKKQIYFIKEIKNVLEKEQYDLLISTNAHLNIYTTIAAKNLKSKVIGAEHGAYGHLSKGWRAITKLTYKNLDKLVLLTAKEKNCYGIKESKIKVIPNMSSTKSNKTSKLNSNNISIVSRIDENKNIIQGIEIFSEIVKNNSDWNLNIYGSGEKEDINLVLNRIKELDLEEKVYIKGFVKEEEEIYLNSDILLMTSKSEGLPMVLIEAAIYGVPAISYDIKTGPSDIIIEGETGFLIEPFNRMKMKEKIELLIEDKEKRIAIGHAAKKYSIRFDETEIVRLWDSLFKEMLRGE